MQTIRLRTWAGFARALQSVRNQYGTFHRDLGNGKTYTRRNHILFRGQSDHKWSLQTTLERKTSQEIDVGEYVQLAARASHEVESFTGSNWHVPSREEISRQIEHGSDAFTVPLPAYEFLVYLRHHGYPSPLLDWTESPLIAAYLPYISADKSDPAVYCYIERPSSVKGGIGGDPLISVQGPYVKTHKRHFSQKAWYTVSTKWDYKSNRHSFCPHELVFRQERTTQDVLVKLILPRRDRIAALRQLEEYNINHFTLFQSEDALIKAIAAKHFDLVDA